MPMFSQACIHLIRLMTAVSTFEHGATVAFAEQNTRHRMTNDKVSLLETIVKTNGMRKLETKAPKISCLIRRRYQPGEFYCFHPRPDLLIPATQSSSPFVSPEFSAGSF